MLTQSGVGTYAWMLSSKSGAFPSLRKRSSSVGFRLNRNPAKLWTRNKNNSKKKEEKKNPMTMQSCSLKEVTAAAFSGALRFHLGPDGQ